MREPMRDCFDRFRLELAVRVEPRREGLAVEKDVTADS